MATTATDLPDDSDERRAHVHEQLGNWLDRELSWNPEQTLSAGAVAARLGLPEPDVRNALNDLVDDERVPLTREDGAYQMDD